MSSVVRLARKARLSWDPQERKYLLLYPERGLLLNEAAGAIAALCDGSHDEAAIVRILRARFPHVDPDVVHRNVATFLARLDALGLIESGARTGAPPEPRLQNLAR